MDLRYTQSAGTNILYDISALPIDGGDQSLELNGGYGISVDITGNSIIYGAGGGGMFYGSSGLHGVGGTTESGGITTAGNGERTGRTATSGQNNTGSGGGATYTTGLGVNRSTLGGSGVVIVRFKNPTF